MIKGFEEIIYENLTEDEFEKSNFMDERINYVHLDGTDNKGYRYFIDFIPMPSPVPAISIGTEKRGDFLKKSSEECAEKALIETALAVRSETGGHFAIHPQDGAVFGTNISSLKFNDEYHERIFGNHKQHGAKDILSMCIQYGFLDGQMEEPNRLGTSESWHSQDELLNNSQEHPPFLVMTHKNIADFVHSMKRKGIFYELVIREVSYCNVSIAELEKSTIPKEKLTEHSKRFLKENGLFSGNWYRDEIGKEKHYL